MYNARTTKIEDCKVLFQTPILSHARSKCGSQPGIPKFVAHDFLKCLSFVAFERFQSRLPPRRSPQFMTAPELAHERLRGSCANSLKLAQHISIAYQHSILALQYQHSTSAQHISISYQHSILAQHIWSHAGLNRGSYGYQPYALTN